MKHITLLLYSLVATQISATAQSNPPASPAVWYKADAGLILSGSAITSWQDQVATRHLNQVVGSPTKLSTTTGGSPVDVLRFDGNDALWIAGKELRFSADRSIVIYARVNDTSDGFLFDCSSTSTNGGVGEPVIANPGLTRSQIRNNQWQVGLQGPTGANNADTVTTGVTVGTWQTHAFIYDRYQASFANYDYTVSHYIDGVLVGTHNQSEDVIMQGLILGGNIAGQRNLNVDIAEVLMYGLLSPTDITAAHTYLSAKWGQPVDSDMVHNGGSAEQTNASLLQSSGSYELAKLRIDTSGSPNPFKVTNITFDLQGSTDTDDIKSIKVFPGNSTRDFSGTPAATINSGFDSSISVTLDHTLLSGSNYVWLAIETNDDLSEGDLFDARILSYTIDGAQSGTYTPTVTSPAEILTVGDGSFRTIVRKGGDDGSGNFRIPALVTTNAGTLIAGFDVRWDGNDISSPDLPGDIDTAIMRSTDGGLNWLPMQIIMDYDENVAGSLGNGVGDPTLLVDRTNGRIWCASLWSKGNNGWNGSGPGLSEEDTGQLVLNYSDDDGITWSAPQSITSQVKNTAWRLYFQGPGKGISTREGILIFPAQYRDASGVARSNFIYSNDHGATWNHAAPAVSSGSPQTSESQIVELDSGDLLISMRDESRSGKRLWSIYSWNHETETIADGSWATPWSAENCPTVMASVQRYSSVLDGHPSSILLFSNPNSASTRKNMTVKVSLDEGSTWPYSRKIDDLLAAYSCMSILPNGDIGILYETGELSSISRLEFMRFPLSWIVGDTDTDIDGMSDFYEDTNGLNKNSSADASLDSDADGMTNLQEFYANTNPRNSFSVLAISEFSRSSTESTLKWQSVPNQSYAIEESTTLAPGSWTSVSGMEKVKATSATSTLAIPKTSNSKKFFRVRSF